MGIPEVLDESCKLHGKGISRGWTTTAWLVRLLSEGDHRMDRGQSWNEILTSFNQPDVCLLDQASVVPQRRQIVALCYVSRPFTREPKLQRCAAA